MLAETTKKPRKLTPKQQANANKARVSSRVATVFDRVTMNIWAMEPIMNAGLRAVAEGGDDAAIDAAMVAAFKAYVPTPTPSIPRGDMEALDKGPAEFVGEPGELALAYAARMGLRVLDHDNYGRIVVEREGRRVVIGRFSGSSGPLTLAIGEPIYGRTL